MAAAGLASAMLWSPPSAVAADVCSKYESAGTNVVTGAPAGTRTVLVSGTVVAAPAGSVQVTAWAYNSSSVSGALELWVGGSMVDSVGSHQGGWKVIAWAGSWVGGDLALSLDHVAEGLSVTYGNANDSRWSRRIAVCVLDSAGGGGAGPTGPPGPEGPPGPPGATGPPCATPPEPCDVEVIAFTGTAQDTLWLVLFAVMLLGGLVVLTLAWIAMQGMRR